MSTAKTEAIKPKAAPPETLNEFGIAWRNVNECYTCPLASRTTLLGSSASYEEASENSKEQPRCGPSFV